MSENLSTANLEGKLVLIKEKFMSPQFKDEKFRYFFCENGFGCAPKSRGTAVFGFTLNDAEKFRINRSDVQKVVDITPEQQARIDQCLAFIDKKENTCVKCGRDIRDDVKKFVDMFTQRPTCVNCHPIEEKA